MEEAGSTARTQLMKDADTATEDRIREPLTYDGGRYTVGLPWKNEKAELDTAASYAMAMKRLQNTEARLRRDKEVASVYAETIQKYEEKGYVSRVQSSQQPGYYLAHFPIIKLNRETTKVRIVFDAAARCGKLSLNDTLEAGPKLQHDLVDILLRFRRHQVAVVCDISEMYMQVGVQEEDRRCLQFLWRPSPDSPTRTYRFNRLVFGLNASPFIAQFVSRHHATKVATEYPLAADGINNSTYMDDTMDSVETDEEAVQLYTELMTVWSGCGMSARKWISNSATLLEKIPAEHRAASVNLTSDGLPTTKTLGISWQASSDSFSISATAAPQQQRITKRAILKAVAKVFDPLGFVAPFVLRGKVMIQSLWASGIDWDEEVDAKTEQ
eukprot:scpid49170/ scgid26997/ 